MKPRNWTHLFKRYRGKWVALKDDHKTVVGSGLTLKSAKTAAEKKGFDHLFLTRVPSKLVNFIGPIPPR